MGDIKRTLSLRLSEGHITKEQFIDSAKTINETHIHDDTTTTGQLPVRGLKSFIMISSVLFTCVYGLAIIAYGFFYLIQDSAPNIFETFDSFFHLGSGYLMFGIPFTGVAAFSIVAIFESVSHYEKTSTQNLSFKAFGVEFSGPAAPATLWIACFLALTAAIHLLGQTADDAGKQTDNTATAQPKQ